MAALYRMIQSLGAGGEGLVFQARDLERGRDVALKFLPPGFSAADRARLKGEVAFLSRLRHANFVSVYDYYDRSAGWVEGADLPDAPFFAMEYVAGRPLDRELLSTLDPGRIVDLFVQFARGLRGLHARGVLHRDLKPSNVLVDADLRLKILDFGLARENSASTAASDVVGTLAYMAPEAKLGHHLPEGDLYALGRIFREATDGRRDLPEDFAALLERLLRRDPAERPHSAASLLKYLGQRRPELSRDRDEATNDEVSVRPPWVGRDEEKGFETHWRRWKTDGRTRIAVVTGPAGVGRTRFVEEMRLRLQLDGVACATERPESPVDDNVAVFLGDLHRQAPEALEKLRLFLRETSRHPRGPFILLEFSEDVPNEGLSGLSEDLRTSETAEKFRLKDLSPSRTKDLILGATADRNVPPSAAEILEVTRASGGRPLLVIEALKDGSGRAPRTIEEACRERLNRLTPSEVFLLALVVVHDAAVSVDDAAALGGDLSDWQEAWVGLQSAGVFSSSAHDRLALTHPSLQSVFAACLDDSIKKRAHRRWIDVSPRTPAQALSLCRHALALPDAAVALSSWKNAADALSAAGAVGEALALVESVLALADRQEDVFALQAYRAPLCYRLGRYEDALKAYDAWIAAKGESKVDRIKHRLYTGQVLATAGKTAEAEKLLGRCLADCGKVVPEELRAYAVRARILLSDLAEREGDWARAEETLSPARPLSEGHPLLSGEVAQHLGQIARHRGDSEEALAHYSRSLEDFQKASRPQAQAIAHGQIGDFLRSRGRLAEAVDHFDRAIGLAAEGGEILQQGRLLANRALALLEAGDYGRALRDSDAALDRLEIARACEDLFVARLNRAELLSRLGQEDRASDLLKALEKSPEAGAPNKRGMLRFAEAQRAHRRGRFGKTAGAREGAEFADAGLSAEAWRVVSDWIESNDASRKALNAVWEAARRSQSPETRADLLNAVASRLDRLELPFLARKIRRSALDQLRNIADKLPEELKMDFEKRDDLKSLEESLKGGNEKSPPRETTDIPEHRFRRYAEINRQIAAQTNLDTLLERILDAAIELTGAERGFLLLKDGSGAKNPLPGYDVMAARHINRKSLTEDEFRLSLSAVKEAIQKGTYLVTDNAQLDPRFQEKKSVVQYQLKSILIVPLELNGEAIGAVYLDHRYQPDRFDAQAVTLISAFASQAALALEKSRLIGDLEDARRKLEGRVEEQATKIASLSSELEKKRENLRYGYDEIIGQSPSMIRVFQSLDRITDTTVPVWILGESGTGKELIARSLHDNSARKAKPFVAENVGAIPETLLESELFGHKKGAFTHADRDRVGLFEQANGGTLFLDEIADMPASMQSKLLRVLQEGEIRPVGSSKKIKIDVRIVSASNKDLREMVETGAFRRDLFFRLNGFTIELPPLRERREDVPLLARHLTAKSAKNFNLPEAELTTEALQTLMAYDWPGNIRELENVIRNALILARGKPIAPKHLSLPVSSKPRAAARVSSKPIVTDVGRKTEADTEKNLIVESLRQHRMDKISTAKALGISIRTLYTRMEEFDIPKRKAVLASFLGLSE